MVIKLRYKVKPVLYLFLALISIVLIPTESIAEISYLQGINIQYPDQSKVNVIISADKPFDYKSFKLAANKKANKPARFVLDAINSKPRFYIDATFQRLFEKDPIIKLIRVGKNHKKFTRVVFDLKQSANAQITEQVSRSGGRLFIISFTPINLQPAGDSQQLSTLITPEGTQQVSLNQAERITHSNNSQILTSAKEPFKIVIDPGHGGRDPGALSLDGKIKEKNINYSVSRKLKRIIDNDPNFKAFLTRDSDISMSLGKRIRKSHDKAADIFISIHVDSFIGNSDIAGASIFVLADKEASNQLARLLAKRENEVDVKYGLQGVDDIKNKDTQFIVRDLQRKSIDNASNKLAKSILNEVGQVKQLFSPAPRKGPFAVLKSSYIPSILIELGYITNKPEIQTLVQNSEQDKIAQAIYRGIQNYAEINLEIEKKGTTSENEKATQQSQSGTKSTKVKNESTKKKTNIKSKAVKKTKNASPKPHEIIYIVLEDDSFASIAKTHNVSEELIKKMNPKYQDLIFPGDRLILPVIKK